MTHFKVDIQIPLRFNPEEKEKIGKDIPRILFKKTYDELLDLAGGVNTTNQPIMGSWVCPKTKKKYQDELIVFTVLVASNDRMTIENIPKIKKLFKYKKILKKRFKQEEIFMVATRCRWL